MTLQLGETGTVLMGKYQVERCLGQGGMGLVLQAFNADLRQHVAIKMLRPEAQADQGIVDRFLREARAAVKLESEHVAKIIDFGRLETGAPFMVMELLQGKDLSAVLAEGGRIPAAVAVDYLLQAIDAVADAHSHDIVHRDLKPANLFLATRSDGTQMLKVLDFGVAKVEGDSSVVTATNVMIGSPRYMSPEQFRSARSVDRRTDIWALGAIGYRLLSGAPPFDGENVARTMLAIMSYEPEPIGRHNPEVPSALDEVIRRCLRKEADERYSSVAELAEALAPFGTGKYKRCVERANKLLRPDRTVLTVAENDVSGFEATTVAVFPTPPRSPLPPPPPPVAPLESTRRYDRIAAGIGVAAGFVVVALALLIRYWLL